MQPFRYELYKIEFGSKTDLLITQLALALSDAPSWCIEHNGLNFKYMYEIIIDYFEDLQHLDADTKKRRRQLLHWWNWYVFIFFSKCTRLIVIQSSVPTNRKCSEENRCKSQLDGTPQSQGLRAR